MNKRGWYIPFMIVAANALAIILQWNSLQEILPAHYDLEGNAGGTMPRTMLLVYPLMLPLLQVQCQSSCWLNR